MNEQEEFFEPNHKRLLSIATWAKYLAWVALVAYILLAGMQPFQRELISNGGNQIPQDRWLVEQLELVTNMAIIVLRGLIYYLVLKGISLGLNMIVETDINYRDREQEQVAQ